MKEIAIQKYIEQLLIEHYVDLYRLAFSFVRNKEDAMDIVQESAYKCILHANRVKQREYAKTWIWKVTMNTALDYKKKLKKEATYEALEQEGKLDHYRNYDMEEAVHKLKDKEKAVIVLYYFEGFSLKEVSSILGMKLSTVKSTLYRSLEKLKKDLNGGKINEKKCSGI